MVSVNNNKSIYRNWIGHQLRHAANAAAAINRGSVGPRLITGITQNGAFVGDACERLEAIRQAMVGSRRLFRQGNTVVFLSGDRNTVDGCIVRPIVVDGLITKMAPSIIGNVVRCKETKGNSTGKGARIDLPASYDLQFAVPASVLQQVVTMDGFMEEIPEARFITSHPVFDKNFNWLNSGYHAGPRILVCGQDFDPGEMPLVAAGLTVPVTVGEVVDRLPPNIRRWVEGFHWNSAIDLINYVGVAVMMPLMPLFVDSGHPGVLFWGNKPNIGKSLAAQCLAVLKDGEQAAVTNITSDRELENQIASELNDGRTTLFFDNEKGAINSPLLEGNMTSFQLGYRGMYVQSKIRRPNDILWLITTNDGEPTDDLLTRCIHIRLHYEGPPEGHRFKLEEDMLIDHVRTNRTAILAEAAGMTMRWIEAGRPYVDVQCRFAKFGRTIGSILAANGLPGFFSNSKAEIREHSPKLQQLAAVAERVIDERNRNFILELDGSIDTAEKAVHESASHKMEQGDWVPYLQSAGVIASSHATPQQRKSAATNFLKSVVKVPLEVHIGDVEVTVKLVSRPLGKRRVAYALAVEGLEGLLGTASPEAEVQGVAMAAGTPEVTTEATGQQVETEISDATGSGDLWGA